MDSSYNNEELPRPLVPEDIIPDEVMWRIVKEAEIPEEQLAEKEFSEFFSKSAEDALPPVAAECNDPIAEDPLLDDGDMEEGDEDEDIEEGKKMEDEDVEDPVPDDKELEERDEDEDIEEGKGMEDDLEKEEAEDIDSSDYEYDEEEKEKFLCDLLQWKPEEDPASPAQIVNCRGEEEKKNLPVHAQEQQQILDTPAVRDVDQNDQGPDQVPPVADEINHPVAEDPDDEERVYVNDHELLAVKELMDQMEPFLKNFEEDEEDDENELVPVEIEAVVAAAPARQAGKDKGALQDQQQPDYASPDSFADDEEVENQVPLQDQEQQENIAAPAPVRADQAPVPVDQAPVAVHQNAKQQHNAQVQQQQQRVAAAPVPMAVAENDAQAAQNAAYELLAEVQERNLLLMEQHEKDQQEIAKLRQTMAKMNNLGRVIRYFSGVMDNFSPQNVEFNEFDTIFLKRTLRQIEGRPVLPSKDRTAREILDDVRKWLAAADPEQPQQQQQDQVKAGRAPARLAQQPAQQVQVQQFPAPAVPAYQQQQPAQQYLQAQAQQYPHYHQAYQYPTFQQYQYANYQYSNQQQGYQQVFQGQGQGQYQQVFQAQGQGQYQQQYNQQGVHQHQLYSQPQQQNNQQPDSSSVQGLQRKRKTTGSNGNAKRYVYVRGF